MTFAGSKRHIRKATGPNENHAKTDPAGDIVYQWRSSDHLDPAQDVICPLEGRGSWGGANDLSAIDPSDNGDANFLVSQSTKVMVIGIH